jgi:2-methylfumaryl-CoA hydratase
MTVTRPPEGRFFEDFEVGQVFHHAVPRTITEADATLYLSLVGERHPLHCSRPLALAMGHRACPIDDLLVFHVAFGSTVADISYNAIANLGYADVRFLAPVYAGDTISCESEVIGRKANSNHKAGVVHVRSRAFNQDGVPVLTWVRWVMVAARKALSKAESVVIPTLPDEVPPAEFQVPAFLKGAALDPRATGSLLRWEDYEPGTLIDHPGGATIGATEHMSAARLYQNPARVHFDALAARETTFKRRLVYGGHVISLCRALSFFGLENAFAIVAIHGGTHANPMFGNDTLYCRHVILARDEIPGRKDVGSLRLRMLGVKNAPLNTIATPERSGKHPSVVLDLDYSVLIPRGQNT